MNDRERFRAATDRALLIDALRPHLENAWRVPVRVEDVEVPRVFPRRKGGLTLQYRVFARRPGCGPEVLLLGGHLLGEHDEWPSWARSDDSRVWRDDALRLAVPLFPYDPQLRTLHEWLDPQRAASQLSRLLQMSVEATELRTRLLAYRLEKRCVLRYDWAEGLGAVVKLFGKRGLESALRVSNLIGAQAAPGIVPRTLAVDTGAGAHVTEIAPGASLHDITDAAEFVAGCEQGARVLRGLHALSGEGFTPSDANGTVQKLTGLAAAIAAADPDTASQLATLARELDATRAGTPPRTGLVHGDFYDKQVLFTPGRTTVLDWDSVRLGDAAEDYGNFTAHLTLRALQMPALGDTLAAGRAAFEAAYGVPDAGFTARAQWWEATTLARLGGIYALRPRWHHLTHRLFERSREALAAAARAA